MSRKVYLLEPTEATNIKSQQEVHWLVLQHCMLSSICDIITGHVIRVEYSVQKATEVKWRLEECWLQDVGVGSQNLEELDKNLYWIWLPHICIKDLKKDLSDLLNNADNLAHLWNEISNFNENNLESY